MQRATYQSRGQEDEPAPPLKGKGKGGAVVPGKGAKGKAEAPGKAGKAAALVSETQLAPQGTPSPRHWGHQPDAAPIIVARRRSAGVR